MTTTQRDIAAANTTVIALETVGLDLGRVYAETGTAADGIRLYVEDDAAGVTLHLSPQQAAALMAQLGAAIVAAQR